MGDPQIVLVIGAIVTAITTLVGALFSDKVRTAWKERAAWKAQLARERREEQEKNRLLDEKGYKQVIRLLDEQREDFRFRFDKVTNEHLRCERELAAVKARLDILEGRNNPGECT